MRWISYLLYDIDINVDDMCFLVHISPHIPSPNDAQTSVLRSDLPKGFHLINRLAEIIPVAPRVYFHVSHLNPSDLTALDDQKGRSSITLTRFNSQSYALGNIPMVSLTAPGSIGRRYRRIR